ncbi:hypothetical protein [Halomonas sp. BC2]|uniref:hypothetical protein n=1 Tax=Halomonas sp. BC2 TaxID=1670449 RepID=UPI00111A8179|nr:hypothetical protein [Halomonas sp. BC2]
MSDNKRVGLIIIIVSGFSIFAWLLLSSNYYPDIGLLASLYYGMDLLSINFDRPFFHETFLCDTSSFRPDCFSLIVKAKYMILLSLCCMCYGALVYKGLVKYPKFSKDNAENKK